jgi:hypothetical protein
VIELTARIENLENELYMDNFFSSPDIPYLLEYKMTPLRNLQFSGKYQYSQ